MQTLPLQAAVRAASVQLLKDYAAFIGVKLTTYPGRPTQIAPPSAFVDRLTETITYDGLPSRRCVAEVVLLHGSFDSADAVAQKDDFVDGFFAWVYDNPHQAGPNTTLGLVAVEDEPVYRPDWQPQELQRDYYATRISLEGRAG